MGNARRWLSILVASSVCLACAHAPMPCEKSEPVLVAVRAAASLNPGEDGQSLPTIVRFYLLKGEEVIRAATADDLQRSDKDTLGSDLIEVKEITLGPSSVQNVRFDRTAAAKSVAIVALVRNPEGNTWRVVSSIPPEDPQYCHRGKPGESRPGFAFLIEGNRVLPER
jgi:type VI secretion system VasD/TssJ family lipoprotein